MGAQTWRMLGGGTKCGQAGGQTRVRGTLATAVGGETLFLLKVLPGGWGWRPGPVASILGYDRPSWCMLL